MNTRDDFIAAVSRARGAPDEVVHHIAAVSLRYGNTRIAANDREITLNEGPHFDAMVNVRMAHAKGWNK
jgi:hypothetical protein